MNLNNRAASSKVELKFGPQVLSCLCAAFRHVHHVCDVCCHQCCRRVCALPGQDHTAAHPGHDVWHSTDCPPYSFLIF